MPHRSPRPAQTADPAPSPAYQQAAAITCTFVNVTGGTFPG